MLLNLRTALTSLLLTASVTSFAEPPPVQDPSSPEEIKAALSGGVPMGRWKEGVPGGQFIAMVEVLTVFFSLVAHGISANPLARAFARKEGAKEDSAA